MEPDNKNGLISVTSLGFAWTLSLSIGQSIYFLFYVVIVDFLLAGFVVATILWIFTNKYLRSSQILDSDVEWGYSFDVHLNAFFPPLILLHFIQLFFYNGKSDVIMTFVPIIINCSISPTSQV